MAGDHRLGVDYTWLFCDDTQFACEHISVVQNARMPIYLGVGHDCPAPGQTFTQGGRFQCRHVLEPGHELNPFGVPLVMAHRPWGTETVEQYLSRMWTGQI